MFFQNRDPYAVLGVPPTAHHDDIKAAYRSLARRHHPDVATSEAARHEMIVINRAWEILGDPVRRAELDEGRQAAAEAPEAGPARSASASANQPRAADGASPPRRAPEWMARHAPGHRHATGWGAGAAGPPPGKPAGSVLEFGIYLGWSLGEVARVDPIYLDWLADRPEGRRYRDEIDALRGRGQGRAGGRGWLG